jgi:hypothetical protein
VSKEGVVDFLMILFNDNKTKESERDKSHFVLVNALIGFLCFLFFGVGTVDLDEDHHDNN